ncbi:MAG: pyridoxamine 5'-phosphate oxidase family protein [Candidatus Dormibacteraeota bacterium]|nr:pyridoxamine 5'-phosphate oxidase family protein [Candidatus Dormibacteraeota bacterium]
MLLSRLEGLDRFLQWDLVTLNPWGTPVWAAVGARLLPDQGEIWTSTTVGFTSKVRNLGVHPRVAMMRWSAGGDPVVIRGEATVHSGDGTQNLAQLFRLMGGPGAQREFFGISSEHPFWRRLYGEYWRRVLIRVRIVEIWSPAGGQEWTRHRVGRFSLPRERRPPSPIGPPRRRPYSGRLQLSGLQMLADGMPSALALLDRPSRAPLALPVRVRLQHGGVEVMVPKELGSRAERRASLVTRVVDDSYEMARMVGWIGAVDGGEGWRRFNPRSVYGFVKPPGVVPDVAAGLVAALAAAGDRSEVSRPRVRSSARQAGGEMVPPLRLPPAIWTALDRLFSAAAADAPWLSAAAALARSPEERFQLALLAQRATMERDFAHSLLVRGHRPLAVLGLAGAARSVRTTGRQPLVHARRLERARELLTDELRRTLPADLTFGLPRTPPGEAGIAPDPGSLTGALALSLAESAVAVVDRLLPRLPLWR